MSARPTKSVDVDRLKAENARLKAENARLHKQTDISPTKKTRNPKEILRKSGVIFLVALAAALLTVGNLLFWFGNTIVKQDRFVASTEPIIKNSQVQQSLALYTTNNIFSNIDVQKITEEVLPPRADFLAPQLTSQLKSGTQSILQKALAKPSFQDKWNNIISTQHQRLVNFAAQYNGNGQISINDIYNQLEASLENTKLSFLANKKIPPKIGNITVVSAPWLPKFHNLVTHINMWRLLTLIILVLSIIAAVWLSKNRRRTIYIFSVAIVILMAASLIALRITGETVVGKVDPQYADGVRSAFHIFFNPLKLQTVTIAVAAVLLGFIAWITGRSHGAVVLKNQVGLLFAGKLHTKVFGKDTNKFTTWVQQKRRPLEWSGLILLTVIMLFVRLTFKSLLIYAFLMLLYVLAIEFIGGQSKTKLK